MLGSDDELGGIVVADWPPGRAVPARPASRDRSRRDSTRRDGVVAGGDISATLDRLSRASRAARRADVPPGSPIEIIPGPPPFELHERYLAQRRMYVPIGTAGGIYLAIVGLGAIAALALGNRVPQQRPADLRVGVPVGRRARDRVARGGASARAHVRDGGSVRRAGDGVRDARVRAARAPGRPAGSRRDRDRRPLVLRARGCPLVDGRPHPVRRRVRARRGPVLRPAERLHRPVDRRVPVDRAAASEPRRLRAPGRGGAVRRAALSRREPGRRGLAVRGGRPVARHPRT